jgi:hypothetical protein
LGEVGCSSAFVSIHWRKIKCHLRRDKQGMAVLKPRKKKLPQYGEIDDDLFNWIIAQRNQGATVSNVEIRRKSLEIAKDIGFENFKASNGWIDDFKKRKGLVYRTPTHTARKEVFSAEDNVS